MDSLFVSLFSILIFSFIALRKKKSKGRASSSSVPWSFVCERTSVARYEPVGLPSHSPHYTNHIAIQIKMLNPNLSDEESWLIASGFQRLGSKAGGTR